ncbi:ATP-binding protein [Halosimplex sp. J119]
MSESAPADRADREIVVGETETGEHYTLPVEDILTGRAFITGKSGSGKSNTASVIAEELLDRQHPFLVVDVDGEYYGLKESYEILHVGATDRCDLQVGPEHAGKLAELALDQHVPIILDVSGYVDQNVVDELVAEVARELFVREQDRRLPFIMLVEEVHEFLPQQGGLDDVGEMLIRVAKRGRKHGLGIAGLSQRPANVKKDFITQADLLVWHRLTWDNDTDVVARVVDRDTADAVEGLDDGEAFVQADWSEVDVKRVQFRRKETFDAGATPGLDDVDRPELKSIGEDLVDELEEISEQHSRRQDRIAELEATIDEKDERIEELERKLENQEDIAEAAQQMAEAFQNGADDGTSTAEDVPADWEEKLATKNETIADLRDDVEDLQAELADVQAERDGLEAELERLRSYEDRVEQAERIEEQLDEARDVLGVDVNETASAAAGGQGDEVEDLRAELADAQERIADLEAENERLRDTAEEDGVTVPTDYQDFIDEPVVQDAIEDAKEKSSASPRYVKGVVASIVQKDGPVDYETVANRLGVSTTTDVSKAASTLETLGVLERVQQSPAKVDFDLNGVAEIKEAQQRREQAEAVMEGL